MKRTFIRPLLQLSSLGLLSILSAHVYASGYKIEMQSASILADSGDAAVVEDAGTNWFNSAGLPYLPQQLVFSAIDVYAPTTFTGVVFAPSALPGGDYLSNGTASSHPNNILPAFHYSYPFNAHWAAGVSVVPAWGFSEDYGNGSLVRYDIVSVSTRSIDIAPSVAYRLNDQWSFGVGPDINYFEVESKSLGRLSATLDAESRYKADDWAMGGHAGILYRINDTTRVGLNYRSKIVMQLDGFSDLSIPPSFPLPIPSARSDSFKLRIPLPPTTSLSIYHDMTPCWALMGTIAYDQWSVLKNYYAQNYQSLLGVLPAVYVPQSMHNTFDVSIGTHYKFNPLWMLRANMKYEPTPTQTQYRDLNFPDGTKLGFQIGARYQMTPKVALDMLYGHVFVRTANINTVQPVTFVSPVGYNRTSIDVFGAQLVWNV